MFPFYKLLIYDIFQILRTRLHKSVEPSVLNLFSTYFLVWFAKETSKLYSLFAYFVD